VVVLVEPGAIGTSFEQTVNRTSGALLRRPDSPYASLYARVEATNDRIRGTQQGPDAVANVILAALRSDQPAARYPAAIPFLARVAMRLPDTVKDRVVRRLFSLDASVPQEIASGVYRLAVYGSNVYVVRSGEGWVLVDAAWGNAASAIRRAAESLFGPGTRPTAIVLTHLHPDPSVRRWSLPECGAAV
jgi:hypothetical protein